VSGFATKSIRGRSRKRKRGGRAGRDLRSSGSVQTQHLAGKEGEGRAGEMEDDESARHLYGSLH